MLVLDLINRGSMFSKWIQYIHPCGRKESFSIEMTFEYHKNEQNLLLNFLAIIWYIDWQAELQIHGFYFLSWTFLQYVIFW